MLSQRTGLFLPLLLSLSWTAAEGGAILAVRGPLAPGAHQQLARLCDFYGDFGDLAVAEGDAALAAGLRRLGFDALALGSWRNGMFLYVSEPTHVPAGATVLLSHRAQILFAVASELPAAGTMAAPIAVRRAPWRAGPGFTPPSTGMLKALSADPAIAALVAQVSKANLQATVTQLASYHTRRADQPTATQAKNWLVQQLQAIPGLTVTTQTFSGSYVPNIIAELPGTTHPERIVVLGGHYDSINGSGATAAAPGADDNASGSAGVLEAARVLTQGQFENTVRLLLFSAEEFGLVGSSYDAGQLAAGGAQVVGMLCLDMIAYRQAGDTLDLDLATNSTDPALTQFCSDAAAAYVPALPVVTGVLTAGTSDHASYTSNGFPAAFLFEDLNNYSPYIHSANDLVGTSANDFDLAQRITQVAVAAVAELAQPVDMTIAHTPLGDTTDTGGPYRLATTVTSLTASSVSTVEAHYRVGGGAFQTRTLIRAATPDLWVGTLPGVSPAGTVEYYLLATDSGGRTEWSPEALSPGEELYGFTAGTKVTIASYDFEAGTDEGWTHVSLSGTYGDQWQRANPAGSSSSSDPNQAYSGTKVWGTDLSVSGSDGQYEPSCSGELRSPAINCAAASQVRLQYRRWLSVEQGIYDQAAIRVNNAVVWQNDSAADHVDASWQLHDLDISAQAAGNPSVQVKYRMTADGGVEYGGWNIDDFQLYSLQAGTAPDLVASDAYLSAAQGGQIDFTLDAGAAQAGRIYVLGMSVTGTAPTTVIDGTPIPLVFDAVTQIGFAFINSAAFQNFAGVLSPLGTASATLLLPGIADPALPGLKLYFAAFTVAPVSYASNPVIVEFGL